MGLSQFRNWLVNDDIPYLWFVAKFTPSIVIVQNMINKILLCLIIMYTYKQFCNDLPQRYQNDTIQYPSRKCSCVFSMEGYFNSKFSDAYEHRMWT